MVYVRNTRQVMGQRGSSTLHGQGFGSWIKKAVRKVGKAAAKVVNNPVGKLARNVYEKTFAPAVKQGLTGLVGEQAADALENIGKQTLAGKDLDKVIASEAKSAIQNSIQNSPAGLALDVLNASKGRGIDPSVRTSQILQAAKRGTKLKIVKPRASAVLSRLNAGSGVGLETEQAI